MLLQVCFVFPESHLFVDWCQRGVTNLGVLKSYAQYCYNNARYTVPKAITSHSAQMLREKGLA